MASSLKNLIAAVLIAISSYFGWTQLLPAYSVLNYLKDQVEQKKVTLAERTEIVNKIQGLRDESISKYNELQRLALVLPEKRGFPELITALESIYSQSGMVIPEIALGDQRSEAQIGKISFTGDGIGTYTKFLTYLDYLQRNIRLYDIHSISVGVPLSSEEGGTSSDPELDFTVEGQFYWLHPAEPVTRGSSAPAE